MAVTASDDGRSARLDGGHHEPHEAESDETTTIRYLRCVILSAHVIIDFIRSFRDARTERVWNREQVRSFGPDLQRPAQKKLTADRVGQHSIRINDQYRICFVWTDGGARTDHSRRDPAHRVPGATRH